ncbi:MAG: hypothetical protein WAW06_11010 [bacterium]
MRLGEVTLSGETLAIDKVSNPQDKISLVVSPFADGSIRSMEVIDWKQA